MPGLVPGLIGAALGVIGIIVLEESQSMSFDQISQEDALKIGLSSIERTQFNSEIDQVNALAFHVDSELSGLANPTVNDSVNIWDSVKDAVSPETFSAMLKIASQK